MAAMAALREDVTAGPILAASRRVRDAIGMSAAQRAAAAGRAIRLVQAAAKFPQQELQASCMLVCAGALATGSCPVAAAAAAAAAAGSSTAVAAVSASSSSSAPSSSSSSSSSCDGGSGSGSGGCGSSPEERRAFVAELAAALRLSPEQATRLAALHPTMQAARAAQRRVCMARLSHEADVARAAASAARLGSVVSSTLDVGQAERYRDWITRLVVAAAEPRRLPAAYPALNLALRRSAQTALAQRLLDESTPSRDIEAVSRRRGLAGTHARQALEDRLEHTLMGVMLAEHPVWHTAPAPR